jgi:hypothetical protein
MTKTRGQPADDETRARVRAVIDRVGWARAVELLGVSQHAIERLLAGAPLLKSTVIAARLALGTLEPQP